MVVGPHLVFTDCSYTVTVTKDGKPSTPLTRQLCAGSMRPKRLIKGIAAEVRAGHVLAILGPSGAGKTTLLNMLTLEPKGGEPVGHLKLNGKPCTFETYNNYCAYVQQFDALWPMLTARDHLNFAFSLFQPDLSSKQRAEAIVRAAPTRPHAAAHAAPNRDAHTLKKTSATALLTRPSLLSPPSTERAPRAGRSHRAAAHPCGQRLHPRPLRRPQAAAVHRVGARKAAAGPLP